MLPGIKRSHLVIVLLLVSLLAVSGCGDKQEKVKETELTVGTAKAEVRDISRSAGYSGIVRGKNEVYIMPKVQAPLRVTGIFAKAGDRVSAGQTLITLDSGDFQANVQQAQAGVTVAEANLNDARAALERTIKLHEAGAVSAQQLEAAQSAVRKAEAGLQQAQAQLTLASQQIGYCNITSPISGVVGSINVSLGDMAMASSPVASVSDTSELEIEVMVSESEVNYIKAGTQVNAYIKAIREKPFAGVIASVAAVPDQMKRNYAVKISLPNTENLIKSGMFAEVNLSTETKNDVVCVPRNAVIPKGEQTIVYTIDKEKRAKKRVVKVGLESQKYAEIIKGIKAGETVITKGNTLVNDGTLVRAVAGGDK